ncbi:LegC family aminotransferase [Sulfuricurvum sp. IAE1]|uniref:LegC family aminotransferase n=1 Tax=Sulfuricurvum sp. IAE1 TaxID=2546102 RepID=UPI001042C072|nr:LegC family aminotransferase [Sulfuricurvum sp. IAE1]TDA65900.1 LegC family aminotransferase [Sulfuricurvum sp. IAE1]
MFKKITDFIKSLYPDENPVPLHAPRFLGNEKKYLLDCIDSTFVSYVGQYVSRFEDEICQFTGAKYCVAVSTGTAALHISLLLVDVSPDSEVITQPLTFVATVNAISYCGAHPVFVDVEKSTLGLDPDKLSKFLEECAIIKSDERCYNKKTGRMITACVPMHTLGHPVRIDQIIEICGKYHIPVVEDAAEALGSFYKGQHAGTFGLLGILSFNGNKPVTTGGGGMIITSDEKLAAKAKHLTTTAKKPHPWEFVHDMVGYNYRMPNINAAVGCAQMERFANVLENKRATAQKYKNFFDEIAISFIEEPVNCQSNYWLNSIILKDRQKRDQFLAYAADNGVQARPVWTLMNKLSMFSQCQNAPIDVAQWLEDRLVNIPSSISLVKHD